MDRNHLIARGQRFILQLIYFYHFTVFIIDSIFFTVKITNESASKCSTFIFLNKEWNKWIGVYLFMVIYDFKRVQRDVFRNEVLLSLQIMHLLIAISIKVNRFAYSYGRFCFVFFFVVLESLHESREHTFTFIAITHLSAFFFIVNKIQIILFSIATKILFNWLAPWRGIRANITRNYISHKDAIVKDEFVNEKQEEFNIYLQYKKYLWRKKKLKRMKKTKWGAF